MMFQVVLPGFAILLASFIVGWGAEATSIYIGQGVALAILAWLQTFPEFAVEALIAWNQRQDLMVANLTGSLRLLVGLGWPLVYFSATVLGRQKTSRRPALVLPKANGLEVLTLLLGTVYFFFIWLKGSLTVADSFFLIGIYGLYLFLLSKVRCGAEENHEDLSFVTRKVIGLSKRLRVCAVVALFLTGGLALKMAAPRFLSGLESLALSLGISSFVFVQWVAPFVSEFPEKVTAFQWARRKRKAPMALMNLASSNIVQWTVMAGLIPVIYSFSKGVPSAIFFDDLQRHEILLTVAQSFLSILFLMDLEFSFFNALGLFLLWAVQFAWPSTRSEVLFIYMAWSMAEIANLARNKKLFFALKEYRVMKLHE